MSLRIIRSLLDLIDLSDAIADVFYLTYLLILSNQIGKAHGLLSAMYGWVAFLAEGMSEIKDMKLDSEIC